MESIVSPLPSTPICFIVLYLPGQNLIQPQQLTVKYAFIDSIVCNYQIQQTALEEMSQGHDEHAAKDSGLLARMEKFDMQVTLKLANLICYSLLLNSFQSMCRQGTSISLDTTIILRDGVMSCH